MNDKKKKPQDPEEFGSDKKKKPQDPNEAGRIVDHGAESTALAQEEFGEDTPGGSDADWDIERNLELESAGGKSTMSYDDFVYGWDAADIGRAPTQEEYENWIQHGSDSSNLYAELRPGSTRTKELKELTDGTEAYVYSFGDDDLDLLGDSEQFSQQFGIQEGEFVVLPTDQAIDDDVFTLVESNENGTSTYMKVEGSEWYEEEFFTYVVIAASMLAAPWAIGAIGGILGGGLAGTIGAGTIFGGIQSGLVEETTGGDFLEGAGEGALEGGLAAGVGQLSDALELGNIGRAGLNAGSDFAYELATGSDLDEAFESALISGAGSYVGSTVNDLTGGSDIANALTSGAIQYAKTGDLKSALVQGGQSYGRSLYGNTGKESGSEFGKKANNWMKNLNKNKAKSA